MLALTPWNLCAAFTISGATLASWGCTTSSALIGQRRKYRDARRERM